jgi:hypothetical protein
MQTLRSLAWWLIGLTTLATFLIVMILSDLLRGQFWNVPSRTIVIVYGCLVFGLVNRIAILRLGETLIHEIGHAQMVALTFGKVKYIRVERDTSGVTYHSQGFLLKRFSAALISLFGPISSAVFFFITARFVASELTAYWAIGMAIFIALILLTTVRNLWGWITGVVILSLLYLVLEATGYLVPQLLSPASLVSSNSILVEAILGVTAFNFGSGLKYSFAVRKAVNPHSDEFKFSKALFLPPFLGARLIILLQLILGWLAISYLLGWPSIFQVGRVI